MITDQIFLICPNCGALCHDLVENEMARFEDYAFNEDAEEYAPLAPYAILARMAFMQDLIRYQECRHGFIVMATRFTLIDQTLIEQKDAE